MAQSDDERAALEWLEWVCVASVGSAMVRHAKTLKAMLDRATPAEKPRRWTVSASGRKSRPYSDAVTVTSLDEVDAAVRRFDSEGFPVQMIVKKAAW